MSSSAADAGPSRDPAAALTKEATTSSGSVGSVTGGEDDSGNLTRPEVNQGVLQVAGHGLLRRVSVLAIAKESNETELAAYRALAGTPLEPCAPALVLATEDETPIVLHLEDLTAGFESPCVADIKMGVRTFVESEVTNAKKRVDLGVKMNTADPGSLSEGEMSEGITKLRYMQFRDALSSSASLGWRVDGLHVPSGRCARPRRAAAAAARRPRARRRREVGGEALGERARRGRAAAAPAARALDAAAPRLRRAPRRRAPVEGDADGRAAQGARGGVVNCVDSNYLRGPFFPSLPFGTTTSPLSSRRIGFGNEISLTRSRM